MTHDIDDAERAILAERAAALARPSGAVASDAPEAVTFTLARERYAVAARYVFAVFRLPTLVRLPGASAPVIGVTRWRGDALTVIDVRPLVGASTTALDDLAIVIVVGIEQPELGILADAVGGSIPLDASTLLSPARDRAEGVPLIGVTRDGHLVLDASAIVAAQVRTSSITQRHSQL